MNNHQREGLLLVVSGPAGVGKGTIDRVLLERNPNMRLSVSATTRAPRPGEIDGVHYFFISDEKFQQMVSKGEFLEYVHVFNMDYYGTPRSFVEEEIALGHDVLLEIDVQGAMRVRETYPDAVLVFIAPPSMGKLKSRLVGRGTETPEAIERRFETAFSGDGIHETIRLYRRERCARHRHWARGAHSRCRALPQQTQWHS